MARALLSEARGELRDDGEEIRIVTENPFAETYFSDDLLKAVSDAFVAAKLNDRAARVEVVVKKKNEPLYEELFRNIDEN